MGVVLLLTAIEQEHIPKSHLYPRRMAAKTFKDDVGQNTDIKNLFLRELDIWLTLDVEGVVPLLKVSTIKNRYFALMPQYDKSVADMLSEYRCLPEPIACRIIRKVAKCLHKVYTAQKVLHLDLKPANLLVTRARGRHEFHIADWGMANFKKLFLSNITSFASAKPNAQQSLVTGGTLPYISPERLIGQRPTVQADVYSLGIVLYELLTGSLPFVDNKNIEDQIITGMYYRIARNALAESTTNTDLQHIILSSIHPLIKNRYRDHRRLIKGISNLIK